MISTLITIINYINFITNIFCYVYLTHIINKKTEKYDGKICKRDVYYACALEKIKKKATEEI